LRPCTRSNARSVTPTGQCAKEVATHLRKEAALALGGVGDPAAQGALLVARQDTDPEVRKAAALALTQLRAPHPPA
jgi:HEAT repeat protein